MSDIEKLIAIIDETINCFGEGKLKKHRKNLKLCDLKNTLLDHFGTTAGA